jgi:hypothetical protein
MRVPQRVCGGVLAFVVGMSLSMFPSVASAAPIVDILNVDVAGIESVDVYGDPDNTTLSHFLPANAHITGIGWNTTQQSFAPSWLSEMVVSFESSTAFSVPLTPGVGDDFTGSRSYSTGGVVDLVGLGLDFFLDADGILLMQFYESFNDTALVADGVFTAGTITVRYEYEAASVPEPLSLTLVGIGLLGAVNRRRSRA